MLARNLKSVRGMRKKRKPVVKWRDQSLNLIGAVFKSQATERDKTR